MRPELEASVAAVGAVQVRLAGQAGKERIFSKGGRDVVTTADLAAEDAIRSVLLQRLPDYPVVGEERGGERPPDGPTGSSTRFAARGPSPPACRPIART